MNNKKRTLVFSLFLMLAASFFVSLIFGGIRISVSEIFYSLLNPSEHQVISTIIYNIRLPRVVIGLFIGAGLAVCGCVLQAILRNPLAEPYTLGISGGASLGASVAIVFNFARVFGIFWLPIATLLGAFISVSTVYFVASKKRFSANTLILIGVVLSFVFSSLVMIIFAIAKSEEIHSIIFWLMGDISSVEPALLKLVIPLISAGIILVFLFNRELNVITLGEEKALYLGMSVEQTKKFLFIVVSLITAACVSVGGIIGFVGLIVPHFTRHFITGPDHGFLIPASALSGAIFLILSDTLARTIIAPIELPVGVITGIFGGVFFLIFILRRKTTI